MLLELHVENFVIIENLSIVFENGFTVFTGESGAGKSIILDCIDIITGNKAKGNLIREGCEKAKIVAIFDISKNKIVQDFIKENEFSIDENVIIIKKVISNSGSKIFINDQLCTVDFISKISKNLIETYSQFEQVDLLNEANYITMLDRFSNINEDLLELKNKYKNLYFAKKEYTQKQEEIEKNKEEIEYLNLVLEDLEKLNLIENEYEDLQKKKEISKNNTEILSNANLVNDNLHYLSQLKKLQDITKASENLLTKLDKNDSSYKILEEVNTLISNAEIQIKEADYQFSKIYNNLSSNNYNLETIEDRIFEIKTIARKHKVELQDLQNLYDKTKEKLNNILNEEDVLEKLFKNLKQNEEEFLKIANIVSSKRKENANIFTKKIIEKLNFLGLYADFEVSFEIKEESEIGIDKINFLISLNQGMKKSSIGKIASGGELSRFMLCLKTILSEKMQLQTIIFDEIDTGVSGNIAHKIAQEMLNLAKKCQVISITHNPQVAAFARHHMFISKTIENNKTKTNVKKLTHAERIEKIGYMLSGGKVTEEAKKNAEILISAIYENNSL